jgi:hypothetical protein
LELIGRRLDAIQTELREFKFGVDVDRRDAASWRTNLITEVAAKLATFELRIDNRLTEVTAKLATFDLRIDNRLAQMDERLARMEAMLQQILNK